MNKWDELVTTWKFSCLVVRGVGLMTVGLWFWFLEPVIRCSLEHNTSFHLIPVHSVWLSGYGVGLKIVGFWFRFLNLATLCVLENTSFHIDPVYSTSFLCVPVGYFNQKLGTLSFPGVFQLLSSLQYLGDLFRCYRVRDTLRCSVHYFEHSGVPSRWKIYIRHGNQGKLALQSGPSEPAWHEKEEM